MRLPVIHGLIRRRLLVNFRVDPKVLGQVLPAPFRPKLHQGYAIAGVCLIRLEQIRPVGLPAFCGISSENAAHRIAVLWDDFDGVTREGVFIPRRDTSLWLNHFVGGRIFPGEHHLADFDISEESPRIAMTIRARDGGMSIRLRGVESDALPGNSCFSSLAESSAFFEGGSVGYSVTRDCCRLDGIQLETEGWEVKPLTVEAVESSFFDDKAVFPVGSATFDHALIMRDMHHRWREEPDMILGSTGDRPGGVPAAA